jgi:hypothetical protein
MRAPLASRHTDQFTINRMHRGEDCVAGAPFGHDHAHLPHRVIVGRLDQNFI